MVCRSMSPKPNSRLLGNPRDREDIIVGNLTRRHCTSYLYLGITVTENCFATCSCNKLMQQAHASKKKKHLNRFNILLFRNHDAPFFVERKVFGAAFSSASLYGCESWIDVSLVPNWSYVHDRCATSAGCVGKYAQIDLPCWRWLTIKALVKHRQPEVPATDVCTLRKNVRNWSP